MTDRTYFTLSLLCLAIGGFALLVEGADGRTLAGGVALFASGYWFAGMVLRRSNRHG